jgi:hypothetical protein
LTFVGNQQAAFTYFDRPPAAGQPPAHSWISRLRRWFHSTAVRSRSKPRCTRPVLRVPWRRRSASSAALPR